MAKAEDIVKIIEQFAPPELAEEWDNSGWQVFLGDIPINRIMLALSPALDVINQAVEQNCQLLISHHPLIFSAFKNIDQQKPVSASIIKAVQNNILIYTVHTNLDKAENGSSKILAEAIGLKSLSVEHGFVVKGSFDRPKELGAFIEDLKTSLNAENVKLINNAGKKTVKKVAVCAGSGGDLAGMVNDVDVYVTGDVKYHTAIESRDFALVDAGHYETEKLLLPLLKDLLSGIGAEILIAKENMPWKIV